MVSFTFRAQLVTDKITRVSEEWSDSCGAYQVAFGFDAEGKEIALCNNGFSQWPNYIRTEQTTEEIEIAKIEKIIAKHQSRLNWLNIQPVTLRTVCLIRETENRIKKAQKTIYLIRSFGFEKYADNKARGISMSY